MKKHFITTSKTARFFSLGEPSAKIKEVWFLLHGYAQNADDFLARFEVLASPTRLLIAPEGLSHFYWKDFTNNPVSSWMTKLDREKDIADVNHYLTEVHNQFGNIISTEGVKFYGLGFSQGCPVLQRWLCEKQINFDKVIFVAGEPAHDLNYEGSANVFREKGLYFLHGNDDKIVTKERLQAFRDKMRKEKVPFHVFPFEGKHGINDQTIEQINHILTL